MNPYIFRKYDIRGIVETDFTDEVVINLGKAFGTFVKRNEGRSISLSGDIRDTTPHLKNQSTRTFNQYVKENPRQLMVPSVFKNFK